MALLGHLDLDTSRGYTAVFQDELIARHQQFITRRRALRDYNRKEIFAKIYLRF